MNNFNRSMAYLEKIPSANSGAGGHNATLRAACECYRMGLSDGEALEAMQWFNANRCNPAWSEYELAHKLEDAARIVSKSGERYKTTGKPKTAKVFTPSPKPIKRNHDEHGPLPKPGLPIIEQSYEVEEAWWARVFAERGIPDPADIFESENV